MKMNILIREGENLVTYYILPLLRLNKNTFSRSFVNSYLNDEGTKVYVEMRHRMESPIYTICDHYISEHEVYGKYLAIFNVPPSKREDVQLFIDGMYSLISKESKKMIYAGSTLAYNEKMGDFSMSHPILHALCGTNKLREWLYEHLDVERLANSGEIIDKPDKSWFIDYRIAELKEQHLKT